MINMNKLVQLRRCASQVSFGSKKFVNVGVDVNVGHHVHLNVGHHNIVSTLCGGSETLTEWKSKSITEGPTYFIRTD